MRKVFDDTVVHHCHTAISHHMRVSIRIRRTAVGRPPGMPDAQVRCCDGVVSNLRFEIRYLAGLLPAFDRLVVHHRNTCGVVPAVFEAAKTIDDYVFRVTRCRVCAYISNDSTHAGNRTLV